MAFSFSESDLKIIGHAVQGTFHHEEGDSLIYGSHDFPSYRIELNKTEAQRWLKERFQAIVDNAQAE